jgi:hypothetical protein
VVRETELVNSSIENINKKELESSTILILGKNQTLGVITMHGRFGSERVIHPIMRFDFGTK